MSRKLILTLLAAFAVVAATVAWRAPLVRGAAPVMDVKLVARGMAFYLEGGSTPNPSIRVRAGESVRVTLRNDTPGILHDFSVADLSAAIGPLAAGAQGSVTFRAPAEAGQHAYVCRPHAQMMRGVLDVAD